jgi:hypothetical protein
MCTNTANEDAIAKALIIVPEIIITVFVALSGAMTYTLLITNTRNIKNTITKTKIVELS